MASKLGRALDIYRSEGAKRLMRRSYRYLYNREYKRFRDLYWDTRGGTMELEFDGVSARFEATRDAGGDAVRWWYDNERGMLREVLGSLDSDDVFFDIGASVGIYSCFCANKLTFGEVVAFEPYEPNREQLRRNLAHNGGQVTIEKRALSDRKGTVSFEIPGGDSVGAGTPSISVDGGSETVSVNTVPGDTLIEDGVFPVPNVIKIDVEGAEPLVLDGLRETLRREECRTLFCEVHLPFENRPSIEDHGYDLNDVRSMISEAGFTVEQIGERGQERHIKATK